MATWNYYSLKSFEKRKKDKRDKQRRRHYAIRDSKNNKLRDSSMVEQ